MSESERCVFFPVFFFLHWDKRVVDNASYYWFLNIFTSAGEGRKNPWLNKTRCVTFACCVLEEHCPPS